MTRTAVCEPLQKR